MRRTERLLDLIALLVGARRPVTLEELREAFPDDYGGPGVESARRKFERDKAELLALGVPLRYRPPEDEEDGEGGYLVDRDRLFLPPLALSPDEMAVVYLAGLALAGDASFPSREALKTALRKMELKSEVPEDAALPLRRRIHVDYAGTGPLSGEELRARLSELGDAIARRKRLRFIYRAQKSGEERAREVEPYGLFCRRGRWSLVGRARERDAVRVFLVERMSALEPNGERPGTPDFELPADFRLADHAQVPAWRYEAGEPVTVELEVDPAFAWLAEGELRVPATDGEGGWRRFSVEATNPAALVEWALGMGPKVRVLAPARLRSEIIETLETVLARAER